MFLIRTTNKKAEVGRTMKKKLMIFLVLSLLLVSGCSSSDESSDSEKKKTDMEKMDFSDEPENVIYLAGGCFWGIEKLMQSIPGVIDTESGYANGTGSSDAHYNIVTSGKTGFKETVRVEYDPEKVSLDALLLAYFYVIDPTVSNQQGNDKGTQYQTGIYYTNDKAKETVERIAAVEKGRNDDFAVEIKPLINYYPAEEYHQNYLEKNPNGYCQILVWQQDMFHTVPVPYLPLDCLDRHIQMQVSCYSPYLF